MNKTQCPNCKSYNTTTATKLKELLIGGLLLISGLILWLVIGVEIPILLIFGFSFTVAGIYF